MYSFLTKEKIAYVRSEDLVYGYYGMQEMSKKYEEKYNTWQSNIDTLKFDYRMAIEQYKKDYESLSDEERYKRERSLKEQNDNVMSYSQSIKSMAGEKEQEMLQSVLDQINAFVVEYGKKNNFSLILGTTTSGNILYGKDFIDVTDELLESLNNNYLNE